MIPNLLKLHQHKKYHSQTFIIFLKYDINYNNSNL